MKVSKSQINELQQVYSPVKKNIQTRLDEFENIWKEADEEVIYTELVFCLLTPQSKALSCWQAVTKLKEKDSLFKGSASQLSKDLDGVRFCNNKAKYLVEARKQFMVNGKLTIINRLENFNTNIEARDWLVNNIKGYGYKEASHFLRNIGLGENIAILDRHILKNLEKYNVIDEIPNSITPKKYLEIESQMSEFANLVNIPMEHLDLLFWYSETGKIFK